MGNYRKTAKGDLSDFRSFISVLTSADGGDSALGFPIEILVQRVMRRIARKKGFR